MSVVGLVARQVIIEVGKDVVVSVAAATASAVVKRIADGSKESGGSGAAAA